MDGDIRNELGYLLWQLHHRARRSVEAELAPLRLTLPQFAALDHLSTEGGLSTADIARRLHLTPQAVSLLAARLEAAGYVSRAAPTAGRSQLLFLTTTGRSKLNTARDAVDRGQEPVFAPLTADDQALLRRLLHTCLREPVTTATLTGAAG